MSKICKRDQIVTLKSAGSAHKSISNQVKVCLNYVHNVLKRYQETGTTLTKPIRDRKRRARTTRLVDIVRKKVSRNYRRSIRKMAKDLQTSRGTIRTIVKEGLGLKLLKIQCRHLISSA